MQFVAGQRSPASGAASTPVTGVDICQVAAPGEAIAGTSRCARSEGSPECGNAFAAPAPIASIAVSAIVT